jgi:hypothetical protein
MAVGIYGMGNLDIFSEHIRELIRRYFHWPLAKQLVSHFPRVGRRRFLTEACYERFFDYVAKCSVLLRSLFFGQTRNFPIDKNSDFLFHTAFTWLALTPRIRNRRYDCCREIF